jgi:spermidine synthase
MNNNKKILSLGFIVFFVSFSVLSLEILYSKIFAVITYYHFSSMIISIALLGFGAAGSYLSLKYSKNIKEDSFIIKNLIYLNFVNLVSFYLIIKMRFYPILLSNDWLNQLSLLFFYIMLSLPFFFGGKILSYIFTNSSSDINKLYFFDLVGGGIGSLLIFFLINSFSVPTILHLISVLLSVVTIFYIFLSKKLYKYLIVNLIIIILIFFIIRDIHSHKKILVYPPPSKEGFKWAPPWSHGKEIEYTKWNIIERLDITKSFKRKTWDFGGDISKKYFNSTMELRYMFKDGIASTGILKVDKPIEKYEFLRGYLQAAPYKFRRYKSVISIGFGGGIDLWIAYYHRIKKIIGVEINPLKVEVLKNRYKEYSGNLSDKAFLIPEEGRHFLSRTKIKVDVIQMSGLDSYPALSSGAFAMSENYVFTKEAIKNMIKHLNKNGVISINRIFFVPPRETLRMVTTMITALEELKIKDIKDKFFIIKGFRWANILLKPNGFTKEEIIKLNKWLDEMDFQTVYNPEHKEQNNLFAKMINTGKKGRMEFYKKYVYRVNPATDNSPFFFQYYKWTNLFSEHSKWAYAQLMPVGLKIIIYSIIQITILGLIFIILPLRKNKIEIPKKIVIDTIVYFSSIGLGFILIEVVMIQKFIVFLGGPIYSLSVILFSILIFSGLGSYFSKRLSFKNFNYKHSFLLIIIISILYILFLNSIFNSLLHLNTIIRIIIAIGLLSPLSFFMGFPFPSGIKFISAKHNEIIPWAWAVNSIFTVFGSVLCLFLSITFGFVQTWIIALLFYFIAYIFVNRLESLKNE